MSSSTLDLGHDALTAVRVARKPILGAGTGHPLHGYELVFAETGGLFAAFDVDEFRQTSELVSHSVLTLGVDSLVGDSLAFMRFPKAQVVDQTPLILPPGQSVIEVGRDTWLAAGDNAMAARLLSYKEQGYKVALADWIPTEKGEAMLPVADYVKVDTTGRGPEQLRELLAPLAASQAKVIAIKIETEEARDEAVAAGVDFVEGFFFARPSVVTGKELPGFKMAYLQLMRKAYEPDLDIPGMAAIIKADVALSYKLLKYVNSAQFGLRSQVTSLEQALAMLGQSNIQRWVSVATVSGLVDPRPQELAVMCATRARFLEALSDRLGVATPHECFSLGMFSLIDVMLGRPLDEALADVPVGEAVDDALHDRPGELTDLKQVAVAYERGEWDKVSTLAKVRAWPETELIATYIDAVEWSRDFFGATA